MFQRSIIKAALLASCMLAFVLPVHASTVTECENWPDWKKFRDKFVSADGRVVDRSIPQHITTSEGQSYALLFALIAGDRSAFDSILRWTQDNLAGGDLTARLPAWQWGQLKDGSWGVLDSNAASDADLWIAYALHEAGQLWQSPRYTKFAGLLAARILQEETADIPGLGLTLLPGPKGFHPDEATWRLNPSYSPIQIFRRFASVYPDAGWNRLAQSAIMLITRSMPQGYAPEWMDYQTGKGFRPDRDPSVAGVGYNAIRVYLWAGMLDKHDPARTLLLNSLAPLGRQVSDHGIWTIEMQGAKDISRETAPPGFSSALLPFLQSSGFTAALREQHRRVIALAPQDKTDNYYDQVLTLFGLGWFDGQYRFDRTGRLIPRWKCTKK
ncbi:MAG TPA: cellulose synthase complex periplasmic endoglucanase BcsZ [Gallionella sp.]